MKRKVLLRYVIATLVLIATVWGAITIYVQKKGPARQWISGIENQKTALIVYDPDPFYNLDEQICLAFGKELAIHGMNVTIASVAAAEEHNVKIRYDVLVYCANTYNWRPDWAITNFIEEYSSLNINSDVVAITLGAGSTEASQKNLENIIVNSGRNLIESYSLWLWRPNNESKIQEPNVDVAISMAQDWAAQVSSKLN
jgi:flavorubredoxin